MADDVEVSIDNKNKPMFEAMMSKMERMMTIKLEAMQHSLLKEVGKRPEHGNGPQTRSSPSIQPNKDTRRSREHKTSSRDEAVVHYYDLSVGSSHSSQRRSRLSRDEATVNYHDQRVRSPLSSQKRSKSSRDEAEHVCSHQDQNNLLQTSQLQKQLDRPKTYDDLEKQLFKAFEAVMNSQKKSTAPRPSSESVATSQEPSCSKEKPIVQRTERDQPLLICKEVHEQPALEPSVPTAYASKEITAKFTPHLLLGTKTSEIHDLVKY